MTRASAPDDAATARRPARGRDRRRRRLGAGPRAVLLRRLALPGAAAGGRAAAARRRDRRRRWRSRGSRGAAHHARRRDVDRRQRRRPRGRARHQPAPEPGAVDSTPRRGPPTVEPGVVQATLQQRRAPHGLRFGPDPSTHNRCTIGGMIGNNACGSRALGYGRTVGQRRGARRRHRPASACASVGARPTRALLGDSHALVDAHLGPIRTELGRFGRQVSGYSLEHLLPENGCDLARFLVGSEGTLGVVLGATVRLVADAPHRALVCSATRRWPRPPTPCRRCCGTGPAAVRGHGPRASGSSRSCRPRSPRRCPRGEGWLIVELDRGLTRRGGQARPRAAVAAGAGAPTLVVTDAGRAAALWRIREDGAGLAGRAADAGRRTPAGRTPPSRPSGSAPTCATSRRCWASTARRGALRALRRRLRARADRLPARRPAGGRAAVPRVRRGRRRAGRRARRVAVRRARRRPGPQRAAAAHVLARRRSRCSRRSRRSSTPTTCSTPACWCDPAPLDADLRLAGAPRPSGATLPGLPHDGGDFAAAVHRCTGVGKCRADNTGAGGVMCPSYLATRDEKDSTRGRARVLQEMRRPGRLGRLALAGGARGAGPVPVLQGLRARLPDRRRHGLLQVRGPAPALRRPAAARCRTTRSGGCRAGRRLPPAAAGQRRAGLAGGRRAGEAGRRRRPAARPAFAPQPSGPGGRRHPRTTGPRSRSGWTPSPTTSRPRRRRRRRRCWRRRATAWRCRRPTPAAR